MKPDISSASISKTVAADAFSKTFTKFGPDPWTVKNAERSAALVTFSGISLTLVKAPRLAYNLSWTAKAEGHSLSSSRISGLPGTPGYHFFRIPTYTINWLNAAGGVLSQSGVLCDFDAAFNGPQFLSAPLAADLFDAIAEARIVPEDVPYDYSPPFPLSATMMERRLSRGELVPQAGEGKAFSGEELVRALASDTLRVPLTKEGVVKLDGTDGETFLFSEGRTCRDWIKVPTEAVQSVEPLDRVSCQGHEYPFVRLHLKEPAKEDRLAAFYSGLLRRASGAAVPAIRPTLRVTSGETDSDGNRLLTAGVWRSDSAPSLSVQGGQGMHFQVMNSNVLPASLSITANDGEEQSSIVAPGGTADLRFSNFGAEPHSWSFNPSIETDGSVLVWKLFSSWIPGDPPNP